MVDLSVNVFVMPAADTLLAAIFTVARLRDESSQSQRRAFLGVFEL